MFLAFAVFGLLSALFLYFWQKNGIHDVPNHRSSHTNITPTGAGICFVIPFCLSEIFNWYVGGCLSVDRQLFLSGFVMLATIGFFDDWKEINYKTRLIFHTLAVCLLLSGYQLGWFEYFALAFIGVGLINACNFLDGVNGFVASQWLLTIGFLLTAFFLNTNQLWILWVGVLIFLLFNFPNAKLFMGDTGSTVLGYAYFYVILQMITTKAHLFSSVFFKYDLLILFCLLPMAFAWFDIAVTLLDRLFSKRSMIASYKDYGFHKIANFFNSHVLVTIIYLLGNLLLACFAYYGFLNHSKLLLVLFAYSALQFIFSYLIFVKLNRQKY